MDLPLLDIKCKILFMKIFKQKVFEKVVFKCENVPKKNIYVYYIGWLFNEKFFTCKSSAKLLMILLKIL